MHSNATRLQASDDKNHTCNTSTAGYPAAKVKEQPWKQWLDLSKLDPKTVTVVCATNNCYGSTGLGGY